ncbi:Sec-independent protein translocase protein TatB [Amycolatopsis australiensis]|nr:Sec-independent protein translocase protein TatB [Amycolatopsis australiensis]
MFGLSIEHLLILLVVGLFVLGPERLPESARWLAQTLHKVRSFAAGAQEQLKSELGPEFEQLRKPLQDLQAIRGFDPQRTLRRYLLDEPTATTPLRPGERPPIDPDAT